MPERTTAEKTRIVNLAILAICLPLLAYCLMRGLWLPAAVFSVLIVSNGYQLRTTQRTADRSDGD